MKSVLLAGAMLTFAVAAAGVQASTMMKADIAAAVADTTRPDKDRALDDSRKPAEILALLNIKTGQTVADVWPGGYWDRLFADAVGPTGKVYAVHLIEADKAEHVTLPTAGSAPYPEHTNITVVDTTANGLSLPTEADVIWIRQNYHDLYDPFMGPSDVPAFNKAVYNALKPHGLFVVIDHAAPEGSGLAMTNTAHRIDGARVKADMTAAGFKLVRESEVLRNAADPRTALVFDPKVKGHTDQFVYVFQRG